MRLMQKKSCCILSEILFQQNVMNMFAAARWCYENHQYQSATTFLEEGVITYFCQRHGLDDAMRKKNTVTYAFSIKANSREEKEWNVSFEQNLALRRLLNDPLLDDKELVNAFLDLADKVRNDYNHCGFRPQPSEEASPLVIKKRSILINLSNHPLETWSDEQKEAAKEYEGIIDMAFPAINPDADSKEIRDIVDEYIEQIKSQMAHYDISVHLMGEMTFTYEMVIRLKELGIRCLASTTERNTTVTSDGKKVSEFNFVQFREY